MGDHARGDCKKAICSSEEEDFQQEPALPAPLTSDDTDLQFWAEDEMSSSDSRLHLVCRQRRRHSLAYRNRVAIRKRSRSLLCQSSSSNSDPTVHMNIQSPIRYNVQQRRRRSNNGQGPSTAKKSKEGCSDVSKVPNPSIVNGNCSSGIQLPNSRRQTRAGYTPSPVKNRLRRRSQTPILTSTCNTSTPMNQSSNDNGKCGKSLRKFNSKRN